MDENDKIARHLQLCNELNDLYARKNHDYGDSFHKSFLDEGMAMPRIRLGDKYNRFVALTATPSTMTDLLNNLNDIIDDPMSEESLRYQIIDLIDQYSPVQKVGDESIRDTLIDLANYALMTVLEMEETAHEHE